MTGGMLAVEVLDRVAERLARRYARVASADQVRALVLDSARRYRHLDHPAAHTRSLAAQLAAALMRAAVAPGVRVTSAGAEPVARILPAVIESLDELGVPAVGEYPKPITPEFVAAADVVVQLDCGDPLDDLVGATLQTWSLATQPGSGKGGMRRTRDSLALEVQRLARAQDLDVVEL